LRLTSVSHHTLGQVIEQRVRSLLMKRFSDSGVLYKWAFWAQPFIEGQPGKYELGKGLLNDYLPVERL
jgi:hypothetical protein